MALAALTSLGDLANALVKLFDEKDMEARIHRATSARTELLTAAALTHEDEVVSLLEEAASRLERGSWIIAALINTRRASPDGIERVAEGHRSTYEGLQHGRAGAHPKSLTARELFLALRSHIAETWRSVPD